MADKLAITVYLTKEQLQIYEEAGALRMFKGRAARSNYLLYLLARDITPEPGNLDVERGRLCQRLMATPCPPFWKPQTQEPPHHD